MSPPYKVQKHIKLKLNLSITMYYIVWNIKTQWKYEDIKNYNPLGGLREKGNSFMISMKK